MNVDKIINKLKRQYGNSNDLNTRVIKISNTKIGILFMESTSSTNNISEYIIRAINYIADEKGIFTSIYNALNNNIFNAQIKRISDFTSFSEYLSAGFTIVVINGYDKALALETKANLDRGVTESSSEPIVRGPKDSFTENHSKNLGLIRKRIKDSNLWFTNIKLGKRTKTKISLAYLNDVVSKEKVDYILNKLSKINIDGILDSGNIRDYIVSASSSFPQIISTERPDLTCQALLDGKIVLLVENSPFVLIMPSVFTDFMHTSEDSFQKSFNITFTRILKVFALIVTLFTPAVYIAITTFDQTVVPDELLISLAVQSEGVPFPTSLEIIILMAIFEILRESDVRMPVNMGTSMSIVGALVLGQAAVDAGIVSPIAVIVVAITSICSLIFTDTDFVNGIRTWRFIFILGSTFMGMIGLVSTVIMFLIKLSSLEFLGTSYLAPFSPFNVDDQKDSILKFSITKIFKRPTYINDKNIIKQGGANEE